MTANEFGVQRVAETGWEYSRTLDVDSETLQSEQTLLVCDGLDTVAVVTIKRTSVTSTGNVDVSHESFAGDATLEDLIEVIVRFRSPPIMLSKPKRRNPSGPNTNYL